MHIYISTELRGINLTLKGNQQPTMSQCDTYTHLLKLMPPNTDGSASSSTRRNPIMMLRRYQHFSSFLTNIPSSSSLLVILQWASFLIMNNIDHSACRTGVVRAQNGTVLDIFFVKSLKCLLSDVIAWYSKVKLPLYTPWKRLEDWIIPTLILNLCIGNELLISQRPIRVTFRNRAPCLHWIGSWVGRRDGLGASDKRKIYCPSRGVNNIFGLPPWHCTDYAVRAVAGLLACKHYAVCIYCIQYRVS